MIVSANREYLINHTIFSMEKYCAFFAARSAFLILLTLVSG